MIQDTVIGHLAVSGARLFGFGEKLRKISRVGRF